MGDPVIEDRVVTEVASYGKQIGWLSEIALALANHQPPPAETVRRLEEATQKIETIKKEVQQSSLDAANSALDRLQRDDPEGYQKLLRTRKS